MTDLSIDRKTGNLIMGPNFNCHLGKEILNTLKANSEEIHQVQITSGEKESNKSVLSRTITVAKALQLRNVKIGDVVMICAANHNDASIPLLSCFCIGAIPINLVVGMTKVEVKHFFSLATPKILFTDIEMKDVIQSVMIEINLNCEIIVFGETKDDNVVPFSTLFKLVENDDNFKCVDFDPELTTAIAVCSSGTTGFPKLVALSHKSLILTMKIPSLAMKTTDEQMKSYLNFSPMYWISGIMSVLISCFNGVPRIQSFKPFSVDLFKLALETHKPEFTFLSPMAINEICKYQNLSDIDFSSLKSVYTGGSSISSEIINKFRGLLPNGKVGQGYGCTEIGNISADVENGKTMGKISPWLKYKIVDPETEQRLGVNQQGEFRVQSITMFQGYYNDPKSTANAFDSEMYYKTGDLVYIDDDRNLHFVDRIKEVIKYRNYQIAPAELEAIICSLPEVQFAAVVGVPDAENGELPMAFVKITSGMTITAQKIKDVIKDQLSDQKQLRGGVVFLQDFPQTYSGKVDRKALRILKTKIKGE